MRKLMYAVGIGVFLAVVLMVAYVNPNQPRAVPASEQIVPTSKLFMSCNTVKLYMASSSTHDMFIAAVKSVQGSVVSAMQNGDATSFAIITVPGPCTAGAVYAAVAKVKMMPGVENALPNFNDALPQREQ